RAGVDLHRPAGRRSVLRHRRSTTRRPHRRGDPRGAGRPRGRGGVESLVTQPCTTTHHEIGAGERARRGISDAMLRLSVGLEDTEDLIADLEQALRAALGR
ncbi:MAG: PLP-dependent transferase, partial [Pseudoxanthomonas sp.]|nr:PLP-dependent transferase [Pseudoxanthomonas sp.]